MSRAPKKQSKSAKNMHHHFKGLCCKVTASDDRCDSKSLSLEQFLSVVGHQLPPLTANIRTVDVFSYWMFLLWTLFPKTALVHCIR